MALVAIACMIALEAAHTIPLPEPVSNVKWQHGRVVALTGAFGQARLTVRDREGKPARSIDLRAALPDARRAEAGDFAADEEGTLHVLVFASFPQGKDRRLFCSIPEGSAPHCHDLAGLGCRLLAADAPDSVWCFGGGPAHMLLHRLGAPRPGPRFWLPEESLSRPWTAAAGRAWMGPLAPGRVRIVLPEAALWTDVDLRDGSVRTGRLPELGSPGSLPSFAVPGGRLLALLPLERGRGTERLDAPYGLFELREAWSRIAPEKRWLRGARLAGAEDGAVWIWNRAGRRLERVAVPQP